MFDTDELVINMGPQHPATHGTLRIEMELDGETVVKATPHIGYLHRGSEKLCEGEIYAQIVTLFDRLDYISNLNNEMAEDTTTRYDSNVCYGRSSLRNN